MDQQGCSNLHLTAAGLFGLAVFAGLAACGEEDAPFAPTTRGNTMCAAADPPEGLPFRLQGMLSEATYWPCPWPNDEADGPSIAEVDSGDTTVSGVPVDFELRWEGADSLAGHELLFGFGSEGYFAVPIPDDANPIEVTLGVASDASDQDLELRFALDDGNFDSDNAQDRVLSGDTQSRDLRVVGVGSGDLQVNLRWDTYTDLDLHVEEPDGTHIFFDNQISGSGGELDLDSYPNCMFEGDRGRGNENVFWSLGSAPSGTYRIWVELWSDCGTFETDEEIDYSLIIVRDQDDVRIVEGTFVPGGAEVSDFISLTY